MYRAPDVTPPRCPSCGATALTNETKLDPSEGYLYAYFGVHGSQQGLISSAQEERFVVNRTRVCLACGHVVLAIDATSLQRLHAKLPTLFPIPQG